MGDAVAAGFVRSEQLKSEWDTLKQEMSSLDPSDPEQCERRTAINARMNQITADMAAVISQTRKILPTPDIDEGDDDHPQSPALKLPSPVVQYSARHLHVVQRTYDSSDDDEKQQPGEQLHQDIPTLDADDLEVPPVPDPVDKRNDSYVDAAELRRTMMADATSADTVITVEGRLSADRGLRVGLGGLGHKLKDKLKGEPGRMGEDENEQLTLELSKLGREIRRLKRIPERSKHEQKRLDDLQVKAAKISDKLGQSPSALGEGDGSPTEERGGTTESPTAVNGKDTKEDGGKTRKVSKFGGRQSKAERPTSGVVSGGGTQISREYGLTEEEMELEAAEDVSPQSTQNLGSHAPSTRRKKGWLALEAGVASIRALGRNVRTGLTAKGDAGGKPPTGSNAVSPGADKPPASSANSKARNQNANAGGGGNAIAEAATRVKQRGEKLGAAADGSEQMANDAGDMLAAVRALRQRNKGGLFS